MRFVIALCLSMYGLSAGFSAAQDAAASVAPVSAAWEQPVKEIVGQIQDGVRAQRRDFHQHPELSNREERTARVIRERLMALGLDVKTNIARHGVVAVLRGGKPGAVVAVRADMDALPIQEKHDTPYQSKVPGISHACGHDAHMAIALGVAEVLSRIKSDIPGSVKFLFQPAEEGPPAGEEGGAVLMIRDGALENPKPGAIFALHCSPELETGKVAVLAGEAQAAADTFTLTVYGKMSHAASPQKGTDAIVMAAACITGLQTIHSRRVDPMEPFVLSVGTIQGGVRGNVLCDEVVMKGTIRSMSDKTRQVAHQAVHQMLQGVTSSMGGTYRLQIDEATDVVYNDPELTSAAAAAMVRLLGSASVGQAAVRMGAEDFAAYQKVIPGLLFRLGTGNQSKGTDVEAHTPTFDIDEDALGVGVRVMAGVVLDHLDRKAQIRAKKP